ncbi:MAG: hypothetical protein CMI96_01085 [Pelagibacteraceae bacterium]|nr:hypothetical protein [Pelagibacteraceae bacterium]|tara:strand:- start:7629 stop:8051 length:423 start_codon:yes stop_codon:yes gene_type:complete
MILKINKNFVIKKKELKYKSIKSSGPGGQNINKNSTAISLHFDIANSNSLNHDIKQKLLNKKHKYLTKSGKIIIKVNTYKSQKNNKSEAISRLKAYLENSLAFKKKRIKTSPKKSSNEKRLDYKRKKSIKKKLRKNPKYE